MLLLLFYIVFWRGCRGSFVCFCWGVCLWGVLGVFCVFFGGVLIWSFLGWWSGGGSVYLYTE